MPHLCGVNQKLIVEALTSVRKGRICAFLCCGSLATANNIYFNTFSRLFITLNNFSKIFYKIQYFIGVVYCGLPRCDAVMCGRHTKLEGIYSGTQRSQY